MHMQGSIGTITIVTEPTMMALVTVVILASMWLATAVICRAVKATTKDAVQAYDLGEQIGRGRGYEEGRRVARPVVVPMPPACPCQSAGALERELADVR
jgi:hypothetical protein